MQTINTNQLVEKMKNEEPFKLIEVLTPLDFGTFHLPGAVNVPLNDTFAERAEEVLPDKELPVIVYCQDKDCDASTQAAKRLDRLGYKRVLDYEDGKQAWRDAGLPISGT